jgi:protein NrfC
MAEKTEPMGSSNGGGIDVADHCETSNSGVSRRQFLSWTALFGIGAVAGGAVTEMFMLNENTAVYKVSGGYLLVDTKKCAGCRTCMFTCSLAHYGVADLSLARIQIRSNAFGTFHGDIAQSQCHQCPYPSCVEACPVEAMHIDKETGARMVDEGKCIGCERCIEACPYTPSRVQWNHIDHHAQKCDLCKNTPHWNHEGGPSGEQGCVAVCPMKAIKFTTELPQQSTDGYEVNLRNSHYLSLGLPCDDDATVIPSTVTSKSSTTTTSSAS